MFDGFHKKQVYDTDSVITVEKCLVKILDWNCYCIRPISMFLISFNISFLCLVMHVLCVYVL